MERGTLYGVGVGPGDPELLTVKAVKILQKADIIAVPDTGKGEKTALNIVAGYIKGKDTVLFPMPMVRDKALLDEKYTQAADGVCALLDSGKTVAFITLGDPSVYSTYIYVHKKVQQRGYPAQLIPGVPSFCAVAARLGDSLCEGAQPLLIIPASYPHAETLLDFQGNKVLMKAGKSMPELKANLCQRPGASVAMVSNCGMENEKVCRGVENMDENAGYFSIVVVKEGN